MCVCVCVCVTVCVCVCVCVCTCVCVCLPVVAFSGPQYRDIISSAMCSAMSISGMSAFESWDSIAFHVQKSLSGSMKISENKSVCKIIY